MLKNKNEDPLIEGSMQMYKKGLLCLSALMIMITGTACAGKKEAQKKAYKEIMDSLLKEGVLVVDGKDYTNGQWKKVLVEYPDQNSFAIYDVDDDGSEELVVSFSGLSAAENRMYVFDYRKDRGAYCEAEFFYRDTRFYRGCAKVNSAKNQGPTGTFWPYVLYMYNPEDDSYEEYGSISAVDSSYLGTFLGWDFPQEKDLDKDGVVFRLKLPDKDDYDTIDNTEYEKWRDSILDEETKKDIGLVPITDENVNDAFNR